MNFFSPKQHFNNNILPLLSENQDLKMHIQALIHYYEAKRIELGTLIRNFNQNGDSREIVKKIGDFQTLFVLLRDDFAYYQQEKAQLIENIEQANQTISSLNRTHQNIDQIIANKTVDLETVISKLKERDQASIIHLKQMSTTHESQLKKLNSDIQDITHKANQLESDNIGIQEKLLSTQKELEDLTEIINERVEETRLQLHQSFQQKEQKFQFQLEELVSGYELQNDTLKFNYEMKIQEAEKERIILNEKINQFLVQKNHYLQEIYSLKEFKQKFSGEIQKNQFVISQQQHQIVQSNSQISQLRVLKESADRQNESYRSSLQDITSEYQNLHLTSKKQVQEYGLQIEYLKNTIGSLKQTHQIALESFEKAYQNKIIEYETETSKKLELYKEKFKRKIQIIRDQIEQQFKQKYGVQVQEILNRKPSLSNEQEDQFDYTYEELKKLLEEKMQQQELSEKIAIVVEKREVEIQTDLISYKQIQQNLEFQIEKQYKELFMQMGNDYHNRLMSLQGQNEAEISKIKNSYEQMLDNVEKAKSDLEQQLSLTIQESKNKDEKYFETIQLIEVQKMQFEQIEDQLKEKATQLRTITGLLKEKDSTLNQLKQEKKKLTRAIEKTSVESQNYKTDFDQKALQQKQDIEKKIQKLLESKEKLEKKCLFAQIDKQKLKDAESTIKEQQQKRFDEMQYQLSHSQKIVEYLQIELENYKDVYNIFQPKKKNQLMQIEQDQEQKKILQSYRKRSRTYNSMEEINNQFLQHSIIDKMSSTKQNTEQDSSKIKLKNFFKKQKFSNIKSTKGYGMIPHFNIKKRYVQNNPDKLNFTEKTESTNLVHISRKGEQNWSFDQSIPNKNAISDLLNDLYDVKMLDSSNQTTMRKNHNLLDPRSYKNFYEKRSDSQKNSDHTLQIRQIELTQQVAQINKHSKKQ